MLRIECYFWSKKSRDKNLLNATISKLEAANDNESNSRASSTDISAGLHNGKYDKKVCIKLCWCIEERWGAFLLPSVNPSITQSCIYAENVGDGISAKSSQADEFAVHWLHDTIDVAN